MEFSLLKFICSNLPRPKRSKENLHCLSLEKSLSRLAQTGVKIDTAIDVGANVGQWFWEFRKHFPDAEVLSVEANPENLPALLELNANALNSCLYKHEGEVLEFFLPDKAITDCNTGASLYKENGSIYAHPRKVRLETKTLDGLGRDFDLIKLDVQGAELDILKGGIKTLSRAKVVQIELSLLKYNRDAPLLAEVVSFLHSHGFNAFDITEIMWHEDRPMQVDMFFANASLDYLCDL